MRERGSGSLFRERYRDRTTGELKVCRTWMMKLWVGGKPLKRSARTISRAVASQQLEQWKAQIRQGTYVPDADQTRFDDLTTLLLDEDRANGRKSLGRAPAPADHLKEVITGWSALARSARARPGGRAGAPADADPGGRERDAHDHPVAVPSRRSADQVLSSRLAGGLYRRRFVGPHSARLPANGRPEPRAGGGTPLHGHEDGRAQDGEHLPALRDRGRGDAEGGRGKAPNAPRGPGARGPRHPADQGHPPEARQFEYRPSQPGATRATGPGGAR